MDKIIIDWRDISDDAILKIFSHAESEEIHSSAMDKRCGNVFQKDLASIVKLADLLKRKTATALLDSCQAIEQEEIASTTLAKHITFLKGNTEKLQKAEQHLEGMKKIEELNKPPLAMAITSIKEMGFIFQKTVISFEKLFTEVETIEKEQLHQVEAK